MDVRNITMQIALPLNRDNDEDFLELIDQMVIQARAKILKQRLDKNGFSQLKEVMQSVDIQLVEDDFILTEGYNTCKFKRSKCKIPRAIRNNTSSRHYYVGTVDKMKSFEYIQPHNFKYTQYRDVFSNAPMYTIYNEYIYLFNVNNLKLINIEGIFEKPFDLDGISTMRIMDFDQNELIVHDDIIPDIVNVVKATLRNTQPDTIIDGPDDDDENVVN